MARLFRMAPAVNAWLVALVFVTVTACSSGPAPPTSQPTPEPTRRGNTAPVFPESETVQEVPNGPTVALPEGAASDQGQLSVAAKIAGADATEIVTVRPFEDGTAQQAEVLPASNVECDDEEFSLRVDAVQCMVEPQDPEQKTAGLLKVCLRDPSGQPHVACAMRDGSWVLLEDVSTFDPYGFGEAGGGRVPEDGRVFRVEMVGGGVCMRASGAGPVPPAGYTGWTGVCELSGDAEPTVMWGKDESVDDLHPFLVGVSEDGYLQVAAGPVGEDPLLYEVARAYR